MEIPEDLKIYWEQANLGTALILFNAAGGQRSSMLLKELIERIARLEAQLGGLRLKYVLCDADVPADFETELEPLERIMDWAEKQDSELASLREENAKLKHRARVAERQADAAKSLIRAMCAEAGWTAEVWLNALERGE